MKISVLFLSAILLGASFAVHASESIPKGGTPLFPGDPLDAFKLVGDDAAKGSSEAVSVEGPGFQKALRLTTRSSTASPWSLQVTATCPTRVDVGDVLYAEFWMRSVSGGSESAEGHSIFVFEKNSDPWTKSIETDLTAGREWKKYQLPFEAALSTAENGAQVCFRMGFDPQVIEIGGLQLLYYGKKAKKTDFPAMKITYEGREPDAPWRKAALDRIEKNRKSDLRVVVIGRDGKPLDGAKVKLTMLRHRFAWGTAVQAERLAGRGMDVEQYKDAIPQWFNQVVFENDLKWPFWEGGKSGQGGWNNQWIDEAMKYLEDHHISIRGHNLVWPSWRNLPGRLKDLKDDKVKLSEAIHDHIREEAGKYQGRLADWDVVNEPYNEHDLLDILGRDAMVDWFRWAHEADPTAKLYLNEYGIFSGGGLDHAHQDNFFSNLSFLKEKGAPIDGLGIQSHLGTTLTPPERMLEILDRFGKLGLTIKITELDLEVADPSTAYDYMRDYLIALYSHPAVVGMVMWGFWDGAHWHAAAPLFTKDWELKPTGKAYQDMVLKAWWTNGAGRTASDGVFAFRGIQGDYRMEVSGKGKAVQDISIEPGGSAVTVTLK